MANVKPSFDHLRKKAESRIKSPPPLPENISRKDMAKTLHDLQVHQVELEMQNADLKQAQEALQASKEKYYKLFNQAPVGYLAVDGAGIIHKSNQTAADMIGADPVRLHRRPLVQFVSQNDQNLFLSRFRTSARHAKSDSFDICLNTASQDLFFTRMIIHPVASFSKETNRHEDILIIISDITEQVKIQKEKLEKQRLKGIVEVAGAVCHELRQPLQILLGITDLIRIQVSENQTLADDLVRLKKQTQRINMLLYQLDNITRYETKPCSDTGKIFDLIKASDATDLREHRRYMPKKSCLVQLKHKISTKARLMDISKGGISFWTDYFNPMEQSHFFCNICTDPEKPFIKNLRCIPVYDDALENAHDPYLQKIRSYRARFTDLTDTQKTLINQFILQHTRQ
ncbi:MAG: PAS domain-containing protein [Desulfotignum sp.]